MKPVSILAVFSVVVGTIYGLIFSFAYPLVPLTTEIAALCAVLGLVTCLILWGLWTFFRASS
jgi:hypothetical protein